MTSFKTENDVKILIKGTFENSKNKFSPIQEKIVSIKEDSFKELRNLVVKINGDVLDIKDEVNCIKSSLATNNSLKTKETSLQDVKDILLQIKNMILNGEKNKLGNSL